MNTNGNSHNTGSNNNNTNKRRRSCETNNDEVIDNTNSNTVMKSTNNASGSSSSSSISISILEGYVQYVCNLDTNNNSTNSSHCNFVGWIFVTDASTNFTTTTATTNTKQYYAISLSTKILQQLFICNKTGSILFQQESQFDNTMSKTTSLSLSSLYKVRIRSYQMITLTDTIYITIPTTAGITTTTTTTEHDDDAAIDNSTTGSFQQQNNYDNVNTRNDRMMKLIQINQCIEVFNDNAFEMMQQHQQQQQQKDTTDNDNLSKTAISTTKKDSDIWTLQDIVYSDSVDQMMKEQQYAQQQHQQQQKQQEQITSRLYTFHGKVDAITPIIVIGKQQEFGLIELYDTFTTTSTTNTNSTNKIYTCTIVVPRNCLLLLSLVQRNDCITFYNMKRKKWSVVQHLLQQEDLKQVPEVTTATTTMKSYIESNISNYVFVVEDIAKQIHIKSFRLSIANTAVSYDKPSQSIVQNSLVTIVGTIVKVQYRYDKCSSSVSRGQRQQQHQQHQKRVTTDTTNNDDKNIKQSSHYIVTGIQWLEIQLDNRIAGTDVTTNTTTTTSTTQTYTTILHLYMTYYPISTSLQLSLQPGTYIQVSNVQLIDNTVLPTLLLAKGRGDSSHSTSASKVNKLSLSSTCTTTTATALVSSPSSSSSSSSQYYYYSTCLRSQFTIERICKKSSYCCTNLRYRVLANPYLFKKVKSSYIESVWRHYIDRYIIKDCCSNNNNLPTMNKKSTPGCATTTSTSTRNKSTITFDILMQTLNQLIKNTCTTSNNSTSSHGSIAIDDKSKVYVRDPYSEFYCLRTIAIPNTSSYYTTKFDLFYNSIIQQQELQRQHSRKDSNDNVNVDGNEEHQQQIYDTTECPDVLLPHIVSLEQVHQVSFAEITKRLHPVQVSAMNKQEQQQYSESFYNGWSGSFHLYNSSVNRMLLNLTYDSMTLDDTTDIYIFGYVRTSHTMWNGTVHGTISNNTISNLPVIIQNNKDEDTHASNRPNSNTAGYAWIRMRHIICSSTCISTTIRRNSDNSTVIHYLPARQTGLISISEPFSSKTVGPCSLVSHNECMFFASIIIVADAVQFVHDDVHCTPFHSSVVTRNENEETSDDSVTTLQEILSNLQDKQPETTPTKFIRCLLSRKFLNPYRTKLGEYSGCTLTLAHFTANVSSSEGMITSQSIDIKPTIKIDNIVKTRIQTEISNFIGQIVSDEQLSLLGAIWLLADSVKWCALFAGGWDEVVPAATSHGSVVQQCIVIDVPAANFQLDTKHGYIRFRGSVNDLSCTTHTYDAKSVSHKLLPDFFEFQSIKRFFPGMIDHRPSRKQCGGVKFGDLLYVDKLKSGISQCTLSYLFWAICQEINVGMFSKLQRAFICPSLVRAVQGSFLGISYCRANAECTKCFSSLQSFRDSPTTSVGPWSTTNTINVKTVTCLRCPKGCQSSYAGIKWECSGVLDDGTGQAKLYAEREVALCLLSMTKTDVDAIEQGVWLQEDGIEFSKSMPPKSTLTDDVANARSSLIRKKIRITDSAVLQAMEPIPRADYVMQHYCRTSFRPMRRLVYLVRCKPLAEDARHLNHAEIKVEGQTKFVHTYTLPLLKLTLVDCEQLFAIKIVST